MGRRPGVREGVHGGAVVPRRPVARQDEHDLRRGYDTQLRALAHRLRTDPEQQRQGRAAPRSNCSSTRRSREWLVDALGPRQGAGASRAPPTRTRTCGAASSGSSSARGSCCATTRPRVRGSTRCCSASPSTSCRTTRDDLTAVISSTVERWDTEETSRRLELQVGRDLQFIRINGTVVGALAGLAIHALGPAVLTSRQSCPRDRAAGRGAARGQRCGRTRTASSTCSAAIHTRHAPSMCSPTSTGGTSRKYCV